MGCLAPRRVWFYLLYPCSNHPRNSFNCFFLHFKRKEIYCYELYLNRRFYRIDTFNNIRILHVVLVKATPTDFQKSIGVLSLLSAYQNCLSAGATPVAPTNLFFMVGKTCFMEGTHFVQLFFGYFSSVFAAFSARFCLISLMICGKDTSAKRTQRITKATARRAQTFAGRTFAKESPGVPAARYI